MGGINMIPNNYLEKVYAGFLGMNIGIRIGAPVEPPVWSFDRIEKIYGNITEYIKPYKNFAADDDVNGPVYFLRALNDDAKNRDITAEDIGKAWLNYTREGVGMFWWGGEGISTEHTAFLNLKNGIIAPKSGSTETNGIILAEQIGGQIFIDTWGLVLPNDYKKAADFGEKAASVSHDGNGVYGARFITGCISKAFEADSVISIIQAGLETIPKDSTYASIVRDVIRFYEENPNNFRKCMHYLIENWGYDKYLGVCHIIPNAGVCVLSLLYGKGDLSRTVEIATMCGWDTDCNAGNVGIIIGVYQGLEGIKDHYRKPINDGVVLSGVSGYLNILDIPTYAKEVALHGYRLAGEEAPRVLTNSFKEGELFFDFELEGSTHNFRLSNPNKFFIKNTDVKSYSGKRSLEVTFDRLVKGISGRLYYKPYYRREDFDDERYKPTFAPQLYTGQNVSLDIFLEQWEGNEIEVKSYIRKSCSKEIVIIQEHKLVNNQWSKMEFDIPETDGDFVDEVGIEISSQSDLENRALGRVFVDNFRAYGKSHYTIDFAKQNTEFLCVTPFAHNNGKWYLKDNSLICECDSETSSYSGNYFAKDISVEVVVSAFEGESHKLILRAQGIMRGYYLGLSGENEIAIYKNDFGLKKLASASFIWSNNKNYLIRAEAKGSLISITIDGKTCLECNDDTFAYGMFGLGLLEKGKTKFGNIKIVG
ncbi:MAG: ADP-ribosylglycohydrolase family protein [Clostridiales bacterium]|nr:ADP-ribosylglycohydrolase family protein [Clostridiales bacterium]